MELPQNLHNVVHFFSKLPGVGEKTATRQALILTKWPSGELERFGSLIAELSRLRKCKKCFFFCEEELCSICSNSSRQMSRELCVVESVIDLLAIEKGQHYNGSYHVLGGVLNPLAGIGPRELKLEEMLRRIEKEEIKTIIVAVNPSLEGDATASYIREVLPNDVEVERIGLGVPVGGALEYLDSMTITKALENRKRMSHVSC